MIYNNKNIVLIGFMGCGKTCVGKRLALKSGLEFIDTDIEIQRRKGITVSKIFENYGEAYFRKMERNLCKQLAFNSGSIIATGGGIIKDEENVYNLKINGVVVYLKSTPEKIYSNLKNNSTRPLLDNTEDKLQTIRKLLFERKWLYEKYNDITFDVTDFTVEQSADLIYNGLWIY